MSFQCVKPEKCVPVLMLPATILVRYIETSLYHPTTLLGQLYSILRSCIFSSPQQGPFRFETVY